MLLWFQSPLFMDFTNLLGKGQFLMACTIETNLSGQELFMKTEAIGSIVSNGVTFGGIMLLAYNALAWNVFLDLLQA